MRINNNLIAINTHRQMGISYLGQQKSMEKLSSGFRINRAGDDAAGLAISEKMRAQIRGTNQASRNAQDTISLIQTAEGALGEMHQIIQRMRELSVQAANDTYTDSDRNELQSEIEQLTSEIDRIANTTEFNTRKLLEGSARGVAAEVVGTAKINNNSVVPLDSIKMQNMMNAVSNDNSWSFDGAFMMIKTNQTKDADGAEVYNANDFRLVGPDGRMYEFKEVGQNTSIKANELKAGTIIADGGPLEKVLLAGDISTDVTVPFQTGADLTNAELNKVATASFLAAGSSFTLMDSTPGNSKSIDIVDTNSGITKIDYDGNGVLTIETTLGASLIVEPGKTAKLEDGTILRNNGGGQVTVESGSLTLDGDLVIGTNISALKVASQSILATGSETARDEVVLTKASYYSVVAGDISTNITIGNGINLTNTEIKSLNEGSVLSRGSTLTMVQPGLGSGMTSTIKILVNGNEIAVDYTDTATGYILKVAGDVIPPGKSITLEDGTVLTHLADLDSPNTASGKILIESGKLITAEKLEDSTGNLKNIAAYSLTRDSTITSGSTLASNTHLMAGTVISDQNARPYPGSVTLAANGTNIQFSANAGASLEAPYHRAKVGETLTYIFSRYEPAASSLRDSVMGQIGANSGQTVFVSMGDMRAESLGISGINIATKFGAATAIETINNATQRVSHQRALLGAIQNRLEHTIHNLDTAAENMQAAESRIRDVDMAREIMTNTKNSILQQSAQAMLAQANQIPQNVLQLLR